MEVLYFIVTVLIVVVVYQQLEYLYGKRLYLKSVESDKDIQEPHIIKRIASRFNLRPGAILSYLFDYDEIGRLLAQAGRPFGLSRSEFITIHRFLSEVGIYFFIINIISSTERFKDGLTQICLWALLIYIPYLYLKAVSRRRARQFDRLFPTFIDMLVLAVNAGMNFEQALYYVTTKFKGIIHDELMITYRELQYGLTLSEALKNLSSRIASDDLRRFYILVKQAKQLGVPISKILAIQSELIITRRIQQAEQLSRTASVKITIPLVFFIFPALLILYLAPALLQFISE